MDTNAQIQDTEIKEEMLFILESPIGRRFLSRLLDETGVYRISHTPNDTHATAFCEGQRNIGLMLFNRAAAADTGLLLKVMSGE